MAKSNNPIALRVAFWSCSFHPNHRKYKHEGHYGWTQTQNSSWHGEANRSHRLGKIHTSTSKTSAYSDDKITRSKTKPQRANASRQECQPHDGSIASESVIDVRTARVLLLIGFVLVLSVIHNPTDRWLRHWRHLHEVISALECLPDCVWRL